MGSNYGDELRIKLLAILDDSAEKRCCEHGIHNTIKANEEALAALQKVINEEWTAASKAHSFNNRQRAKSND